MRDTSDALKESQSQASVDIDGIVSSDNDTSQTPEVPGTGRAASLGTNEILGLTSNAESSSEVLQTSGELGNNIAGATTGTLHRPASQSARNTENRAPTSHFVRLQDEPPVSAASKRGQLNRTVSLSAQNVLALTKSEDSDSSSEFFLPGGAATTPASLHRSTLIAKKDVPSTANRESSDNSTVPAPLYRSTLIAKKDVPAIGNWESSDPLTSDVLDRSDECHEIAGVDNQNDAKRASESLTDSITAQQSGEEAVPASERSLEVPLIPGAFNTSPVIGLEQNTNENVDNHYINDSDIAPIVESGSHEIEIDVQSSQITEVVAADEEDERIREQLRMEIMEEAIEAKVIEKRSSCGRNLLLWTAAITVLVGSIIGLAVGFRSSYKNNGSQGVSDKIEVAPSPAPTSAPITTSTPSDFPTPPKCPCFSVDDLLELRSSLPDGFVLNCGSIGPTSMSFNCRDDNVDCGFQSRVFCTVDCDVFTLGMKACTVIEEDVGKLKDDTVEVTEAEAMACREIIHVLCP